MSKNITETQLSAVRLLSTGAKAVYVADAVGVTRETISRWRQEPAFIAALNEELSALHEDSRAAMRNLQGSAVAAVSDLLADPATPSRTRLAAATYVLTITSLSVGALEAVGPGDEKSVKDFANWRRMSLESRMCADIR